MDLTLDDEQRLIADSASDFLERASPMASVRRCIEQGDGLDRALWQELAGLGWCGVRLPAQVDGLGAGWVEVALLQEQLGRRLACVPYLDSAVLATTVLQSLAHRPAAQALWPQLARGELIVALALATPPAPGTARAMRSAHGWTLGGAWPRIGSAPFAQRLLLPACDQAGMERLFLVPADAPGLALRPLGAIDPTRRCADVHAQALQLDAAAELASGAALAQLLEQVRCLGAIALAAEQVGVAQQALDLTLAYTAGRTQFGRAIAGFQAVKHRCAQMLVALETARSAVYEAACTADTEPDPQRLLLCAAQALDAATEAALLCSRESIQLHGGVGFTWEYDPHLYLRRAQVNSQLLGPLGWWRERVAALLLDEPRGRP